jgi:hypothetical protein
MEEPNTVTPEQMVTGSTAPTYLFSINNLLTEHELLLQQEERDRALAKTIESPNVAELGLKLKEWAIAGFPHLFPILSFHFSLPVLCSDGVARTFAEYFVYLAGCTISEQIQNLQSKLDGISVHCEYTGPTSLTLRVSKA